MIVSPKYRFLHFPTLITPSVLITRGLYWSVLEGGLALIACCFPTLHVLYAKASLEGVVRSIRSAVSLGSLGSGRSNQSNRSGPLDPEVQKRNDSTASHTAMVLDHPVPASFETYALGNAHENSVDDESSTHQKIWVNSTFEQSAKMV